jgi:hypothetical protein
MPEGNISCEGGKNRANSGFNNEIAKNAPKTGLTNLLKS